MNSHSRPWLRRGRPGARTAATFRPVGPTRRHRHRLSRHPAPGAGSNAAPPPSTNPDPDPGPPPGPESLTSLDQDFTALPRPEPVDALEPETRGPLGIPTP